MEKKTKTFREYFEKYPEPYRSQAIKNAGEDIDTESIFTDDHLGAAFVWGTTPEGHDYWENFYNTHNGKTYS